MGHVFINYNPKDKDLARFIATSLNEKGILTWVDILNILPGTHWYDAIQHAMSTADAIVLLLSEKDVQNTQTTEEYFLSGLESIKTIIVTTANIHCIQLPTRLARFDCVDSNNSDYISQLIEVLPQSVKTETPQPSREKASARGYIFLSYSIEDINFVAKLRNFFADKGYAYWDYQQTSRKYHMPFHLEIEESIEAASAIVSVVSPDWKRSTWATREFLFSEQLGKTNFICIAREVGATLLYADKTFIEFFANEEKGFDLLDKALRREGLID